MGRINWGRVLLGGILAGILLNISETVLNAVVLKSDWEAAMRAMGKTVSMAPSTLAVWIFWGFLDGILIAWLYAAIRPRFGAGARTGVRAGFFAWMLSGLLSTIAMWNMDLFPARLLVIAGVWELVEATLAGIVAGWAYREA